MFPLESIINNLEYDYNSRNKIIRNISSKYPFLKISSIGRSVLGKELISATLGDGKKQVLYCGGFHGSEHITCLILLKFLEELCYCYHNNLSMSEVNARVALKERSLTVIPCINPDGCDIAINGNRDTGNFYSRIEHISNNDYRHWNANARGVDINHNFPAGWKDLHELERENGIFSFSSRQYGGKRAGSEPETHALMSFCRKQNFRHAIAFHSQGEVIYWGYNKIHIKNAQKMAEIMSAVSGYKMDSPSGLAIGGGFKDWFITEFSRPAFTLELGKGENPLNIENADKIYKQIKELLMLSIIM